MNKARITLVTWVSAALKENGYFLANGPRGPVAIDIHLGVHSIARTTRRPIKEVRARIDRKSLIDTETRKGEIAKLI